MYIVQYTIVFIVIIIIINVPTVYYSYIKIPRT